MEVKLEEPVDESVIELTEEDLDRVAGGGSTAPTTSEAKSPVGPSGLRPAFLGAGRARPASRGTRGTLAERTPAYGSLLPKETDHAPLSQPATRSRQFS